MALLVFCLLLPIDKSKVSDGDVVFMARDLTRYKVEYGLIGIQAKGWKLTFRHDIDDSPGFYGLDYPVVLYSNPVGALFSDRRRSRYDK